MTYKQSRILDGSSIPAVEVRSLTHMAMHAKVSVAGISAYEFIQRLVAGEFWESLLPPYPVVESRIYVGRDELEMKIRHFSDNGIAITLFEGFNDKTDKPYWSVTPTTERDFTLVYTIDENHLTKYGGLTWRVAHNLSWFDQNVGLYAMAEATRLIHTLIKAHKKMDANNREMNEIISHNSRLSEVLKDARKDSKEMLAHLSAPNRVAFD